MFSKCFNLTSINIDTSKEMEVALRNEIKIGKATILCSLDNQNPQEYEIEIQKIYKENNYSNKSMQIKVTDQRLLEKTGGIIQGMSGSPIVQDGKLIGGFGVSGGSVEEDVTCASYALKCVEGLG